MSCRARRASMRACRASFRAFSRWLAAAAGVGALVATTLDRITVAKNLVTRCDEADVGHPQAVWVLPAATVWAPAERRRDYRGRARPSDRGRPGESSPGRPTPAAAACTRTART